ncbi:MAG: hypothetical protein RL377_708 [Bacteroidota bacterium]|jgi:hypothetical protein
MKNMKIKFLALGSAFVLFTSCLKEATMNTDPSTATNVVELANTGDNYAPSGVPGYYSDLGSVAAGASKSFNVNVHYTGPGAAPADIVVRLGIDAATLASYNTRNGSSKEVPPTGAYSFPDSVIIKKGTNQTTVDATITVTPSFDFSKSYALPIKITSVSAGRIISGNYGASVYAFGVRNEFDGVYNYRGYALRAGDAVLTGYFSNKRMNLLTIGARAVQFGSYALWGDGAGGIGIGYPTMTISSTGTGGVYPVTFASSGGAYNAPGYNSRYDAGNRTFYVSATWGAGPSARLLVDTLTYIGPRP